MGGGSEAVKDWIQPDPWRMAAVRQGTPPLLTVLCRMIIQVCRGGDKEDNGGPGSDPATRRLRHDAGRARALHEPCDATGSAAALSHPAHGIRRELYRARPHRDAVLHGVGSGPS